MINRDLKIHLQHLQLSGYEDGRLQWLGSKDDFKKVEAEINELDLIDLHAFENINR